MLGCARFTEEEALSHTLTYAAASYETAALIMQWAIVALSKFPKVQHRPCEEIRAHLYCLHNVFDFSPHADAQVYAVPKRLLQSGRPPFLPNVYDYKRGNPGYVYPLNTSTTRNPCHRTPSYHDSSVLG